MDNENQEQGSAEVNPRDEETTVESQADVIDRKAFEDQRARAEKAEQQLKEYKAKLKAESKDEKAEFKKDEGKQQDSLSTEEIRIIAKYDDDGLDKLKKIAQVEGISLTEAVSSDLFEAWTQKQEEKKRQEQAQLRASRGSGSSTKPMTFKEAGKDPEAHKKMLKAYLRQKHGR